MKLIVDLTRANATTEKYLFDRVVAAHPGVSSTDIVVFRFGHQPSVGGLESLLPDGIDYSLIIAAIWNKVSQWLDSNSTEAVTVFSFHGATFGLRSRLTSEQQESVQFRSFSSLRPQTTAEIQPAFRWPESLMPLEDAIGCLVRALQDVNAREPSKAVRQTDLRGHLARVDKRLDKSNPAASSPGLISALIRAAEQRGVVGLDRRDVVNPWLWLTEPKREKDEAGSKKGGAKDSRSQSFLNELKSQRLGPFSTIRKLLYDGAETALASGPITMGELLKRAVDLTRDAAKTQELDEGRYPWRKVREFLTEVLTRRPVLLAEDGSILVPSFGNLIRKVKGLREGWRLDLEGELVLALERAGLDIRLADVSALAGALFLERSDETEAETAIIISHLLGLQRLSEAPVPGQAHRLEIPHHGEASSGS